MDIALSTSNLDIKTSDNNTMDISQCIQNILLIPFQQILSDLVCEEKSLLQSEEIKIQESDQNINDNYFILDISNFNGIKDTLQYIKSDNITNISTNNQATIRTPLDNQNTDYPNQNSQSNNIINNNHYNIEDIEENETCKNNEYTKNQVDNLEKDITILNTNINFTEVSKTNKNLDTTPTLISKKDLINDREEIGKDLVNHREEIGKDLVNHREESENINNTNDLPLYQKSDGTHDTNQDKQEEEVIHDYNNHNYNNKLEIQNTHNLTDNNITYHHQQSQLQELIEHQTQLPWNFNQETVKYHEYYKTHNINNIDVDPQNHQLKVNFDIVNENENAELEISFNDNTSVEITFKTNQYIGLLNKSMYLIRHILQEFGYNNIVIKQENNSNNTNKKLSNTYIAEEDDEKFFNNTYTKQKINSQHTNTIHTKLLDKQVFGYI